MNNWVEATGWSSLRISMKKHFVLIGDTVALLITTLIGFITHGEGNLSFLPRFLAAFVPITITWLILSPWFGLFQPEITSNPKQLWRVLLAMLFAAPLAGTVRGALLVSDIIPTFVVVFGITSATGIVVWRVIWCWLRNKKLQDIINNFHAGY